MNRVTVSDYKNLIRGLRDEDNYPMNAVVRFDDQYNLELTSDLYSCENQYELGRACDVSEPLGCDFDQSLSENLREIKLETARWLTTVLDSIIRDRSLEDSTNI